MSKKSRTRRPRGSGSIQMRTKADGSATYYAVYWDAANVQRWKAAGPTARHAQELLNQLLTEVQDAKTEGQPEIASERSMRYYADRFLRQNEDTGAIRKTTTQDYLTIIYGHLLPSFDDGSCRVIDVEPEDVRKYIAAKKKGIASMPVRSVKREFDPAVDGLGALRKPRALSAKTIRNHIAVLHAILDLAIADEVIAINPVKGAELPKLKMRRPLFIDQRELELLVDVVDPRWKGLTAVLCFSGLRLGEARALQWRDIDFDRAEIHVSRSSSRGGEPGDPKSEMSFRRVPVRRELIDLLAELKTSAEKTGSKDFIFTSESGKLVCPDNYRSRIFRAAVEKADLPDRLRIHDLRHSFCSVLMLKNRGETSLKAIQATMGHSTFAVTTDIYTHVFGVELGSMVRV